MMKTYSTEKILKAIKDFKDMSFESSIVKTKIKQQSYPFGEHFVKIKIYKNITNDFNDWMKTLCDILMYVNNLTTKPKMKKLDASFYRDEFLFGNLNEPEDIKTYLYGLYAEGYPEIYEEITEQDFENIFNDYVNMSNELSNILSTKNNYIRENFSNIIKKYI